MSREPLHEEPREPEEPPPFLGTWNRIYALTIGLLIFWIIVFWIFTEAFS